jgi:hypothetical protein
MICKRGLLVGKVRFVYPIQRPAALARRDVGCSHSHRRVSRAVLESVSSRLIPTTWKSDANCIWKLTNALLLFLLSRSSTSSNRSVRSAPLACFPSSSAPITRAPTISNAACPRSKARRFHERRQLRHEHTNDKTQAINGPRTIWRARCWCAGVAGANATRIRRYAIYNLCFSGDRRAHASDDAR